LCGKSFEIRKGVFCAEAPRGRQSEIFSHAWASGKDIGVSVAAKHRLSAFPIPLAGTILELGAGEAGLARAFPALNVMSTDLLIDGIADLGERAAACPITDLPFKSRSFDLAVALEVLEHLKADERTRAIAEIQRVLRPGGLLLISVPTWPIPAFEWLYWAIRRRCWPDLTNLGIWNTSHETRFREGSLERELLGSGLELIGSRSWCKSASAFGLLVLSPVARRLRLRVVDLSGLDRLLPFDFPSNRVILARKPSLADREAG
jgi:SAM-dependent methyltransferase